MIEHFFDEYNLSEAELKHRIYKTLYDLHKFRPEEWSIRLLELAYPDQPSLQIVQVLLKASPEEIENQLNSQRVNILDLLRIASFSLDTLLDDIHLENLLFKQSIRYSLHHLYKMSFVIICLILVEEQRNQINFDRDFIYDLLDRNPNNLLEVLGTFEAMIFVQQLEKFFEANERNKSYTDQINNFNKSIIEYVSKNCLTTSRLSIGSLFAEAYVKYFNNIDFSQPLTSKNRKEFLNKLRKINHKTLSQRLEIKHGGKREREGFIWTNECKIEFYKTVEDLPKIRNKPMWDYAYENLKEEDFNYKYIEYLRTETAFKDVTEKLFRDAVRTWRKYKDSFEKPKPDEKPFAFALNHALHLLDYPETKYSTMKRYYGEGKKLLKNNHLNNEDSK